MRPPFLIRGEIAPGADLTGPPDDYVWQTVIGNGARRMRTEIEFSYGRDDEAADLEPATGSVTFDDRDGALSPRNPLGPWYGQLVDGTPIRFALEGYGGDDFDRTVSPGWGTSSSGHVWTNASSAWSVAPGEGRITLATGTASYSFLTDVTGLNLRVRAAIKIDAMPASDSFVFGVALRAVDTSNGYWAYFEFRSTGVMSVKLVRRDAGVNSTLQETITAVPFVVGTPVEICVEAEGNRLRGKVWEQGDPEPEGWDTAQVIGRIDGNLFGAFGWRLATGASPITVAVSDLTVEALVFSGDLTELPLKWDKSGRDSTVPAGLAGPFQRLLQNDDDVLSPLRRQLPSYLPASYFPFEGSTSNAVPGARAATATRCTLGESDAPAGSASAGKMTTDISYVFMPADADTGAEWAGMILLKLGDVPASDTPLLSWTSPTGTVARWQLYVGATTFSLLGFNSSGGTVFDSGAWGRVIDVEEWFSIQLETVQDGGNVDYALLWGQVGAGETSYAMTGTFAGTTRALKSMYLQSATVFVDTLFCHAWLGPESLPYISNDFRAVASGYEGESIRGRLGRLIVEAGQTISIPVGDTEDAGPQPRARFLDLVQECTRTDLGVFMEDGYGYRYETRTSRYNKDVRMTIEWSGDDGEQAGGDLWESPEPVDDGQRYRNRMTVTNSTTGSSSTVEDTVEIARRGLRRGQPPGDLNLADDTTLDDQASWRLWLAKWDELRWPRITLNLVQAPHLIPGWLSCRVGSRIRIVGPKSQVAGQWIDLIIEGAEQRIGRNQWLVTLSCSPALAGDVALYDTATKRKDSPSTVLVAGVDADDVSWQIITDHIDDCWSTDPTYLGYVWDVEGEEVRVDGMTSPAGTGPYTQTATVTRAFNGVAKAHDADTPIRMALRMRARYAL